MRFRNRFAAFGVVAVVTAWCAMGGLAMAVFPNFSDCPSRGLPTGSACVDIQSLSGEFVIKGFRVPLDHSLEIRGALREPDDMFIPPAGTNGFFATPVNVPGGLLGLELPFGFNLVLATAELAGSASDIHIEAGELKIDVPIKLRLSNTFLSSNCHIGSNSSPIRLHLIIGTTNPPPPNRPISGHTGTPAFTPPNILTFMNILDVENSFAIPGATECGGLLGINNVLIDLKLGLPSAAGNNSISINNNAGLALLP